MPGMTDEERERRRMENLQLIQDARLMDDPFMTRVFQDDTDGGQLLATLMTGRDDITVTKVITQHELPNLRGRSVRLDIHAFDHDRRDIDIEIQRAKKGASPKRIRYNSGMMDSNFLVKREDFDDLPEQYIFFITEKDVTGLHQLITPVERRMGPNWSLPFQDGIHIAYIDSSKADDSPLGKLMHDFRCQSADEMYYPLLRERVRYYKETDKGVTIMSDLFEEIRTRDREEGKAEGMAEGKAEGKAEGEGNIVLNMLKGHEALDKIKTFSGWTADQIRALAQKNGLAVE